MAKPEQEQIISLPFVFKGNLSAPEAEHLLFSQARKRRIVTCFIREENGQLFYITRKPHEVLEEIDAVGVSILFEELKQAERIVISGSTENVVKRK